MDIDEPAALEHLDGCDVGILNLGRKILCIASLSHPRKRGSQHRSTELSPSKCRREIDRSFPHAGTTLAKPDDTAWLAFALTDQTDGFRPRELRWKSSLMTIPFYPSLGPAGRNSNRIVAPFEDASRVVLVGRPDLNFRH